MKGGENLGKYIFYYPHPQLAMYFFQPFHLTFPPLTIKCGYDCDLCDLHYDFQTSLKYLYLNNYFLYMYTQI